MELKKIQIDHKISSTEWNVREFKIVKFENIDNLYIVEFSECGTDGYDGSNWNRYYSSLEDCYEAIKKQKFNE